MLNFDSVYLDFDGTITKEDSVCKFFHIFADKKWVEIESLWREGKINSKVCMQIQLDLISNLTYEKFYRFLNSIEIQDGFIEFCNFMKENNKPVTVLSDGFDVFIDFVLKKAGVDIHFFANRLIVEEKGGKKEGGVLKFKLEFPHKNCDCKLGLGMCKCSKIAQGENFLYTGDGLSDRCIASKSKLLFSKNSLKDYCLKNDVDFIEFADFFDILNYLKKGTGNNAKCTGKGEAF